MGILFTIFHKNVIIRDSELLASQNLTLYCLFLQYYISLYWYPQYSPLTHLVDSPKLYITILSSISSWNDCNTQEKLKAKVMQNFKGPNKVYYGRYAYGELKQKKMKRGQQFSFFFPFFFFLFLYFFTQNVLVEICALLLPLLLWILFWHMF